MIKANSEASEQIQLVNWLREHDYFFTMINNDMWTSSFSQKRKQKLMWMNAWMSDLIIKLKRKNILFLELKKAPWKRWGNNWSITSEAQLEWQKQINECEWVEYVIARGFIEAKEIIERLEIDKE